VDYFTIQVINIYSKEAKNRYAQFGDPTNLEMDVTASAVLWLPYRKCMGKAFSDENSAVANIIK